MGLQPGSRDGLPTPKRLIVAQEKVLLDARFNPKVKSYWLLSGTVVLTATIVGIPLLPFWWTLGYFLTGRYLDHMSARLTTRSLKVGKGVFVRQEKTVPLDKITDVALLEGPIMRMLDLQAVKIETAGSSAGAFLQIVGIEKTREFRDRVLAQRDRVSGTSEDGDAPRGLPGATSSDTALLTEIRDTLVRIEERLPTMGGPAS